MPKGLQQDIIGSYTSFYRSQIEQDRVDPKKADLESMKILGFSHFSPTYLAAKVRHYFNNCRNGSKFNRHYTQSD